MTTEYEYKDNINITDGMVVASALTNDLLSPTTIRNTYKQEFSSYLSVQDSLPTKLENDFFERCVLNNINTYSKTYISGLLITDVVSTMLETYTDATMMSVSENKIYIFNKHFFVRLISDDIKESKTYITIRATKEMLDTITGLFPVITKIPYINWYFVSNNSFDHTSVPLKNTNQPVDEMYPFIENGLNAYYDKFMESNASILLLIGPPGTGKTSMLRGLLNYTGKSAMMTYDERLLQDDSFFIQFIKNDNTFLIIEDADTMIRPRDEGNSLVSRFLNMSDGIMDIKNKKIIFTTNLDSIDKIDPALTREGRCFDIMHFRNLHHDEALKLANKYSIEFDPPSKIGEYAISEIFNKKRNNTPKQKVGFI